MVSMVVAFLVITVQRSHVAVFGSCRGWIEPGVPMTEGMVSSRLNKTL
jgi:hypothetical protein